MKPYTYPEPPVYVAADVTGTSPEFRKEVKKMILSLALFALLYLLLCVSGAFAAFCLWVGIMLIITAPGPLTIFLGGGIIGFGFFIFFYLVKFLFAKKEDSAGARTEIRKTNRS